MGSRMVSCSAASCPTKSPRAALSSPRRQPFSRSVLRRIAGTHQSIPHPHKPTPQEKAIQHLVDFVIEEHGGAARWDGATSASPSVHVHSVFWPHEGQPDRLGVETVTADLTRQRIAMSAYGDARTLNVDAIENLVTITDADGNVVDELSNPRASMAGHQRDMQWSPTRMGLK